MVNGGIFAHLIMVLVSIQFPTIRSGGTCRISLQSFLRRVHGMLKQKARMRANINIQQADIGEYQSAIVLRYVTELKIGAHLFIRSFCRTLYRRLQFSSKTAHIL